MEKLIGAAPDPGKRISGEELERGLAAHEFEAPAGILRGMVKASKEAGHISFTPSGCDSWTDIPTSMIKSAEQIGLQTCRDHSHPVFALTLVEPTDPLAKILSALLGNLTMSGFREVGGFGPTGGPQPAPGAPVDRRIGGGGFGGPGGRGLTCTGCRKVCDGWRWTCIYDFTGKHCNWGWECDHDHYECKTCW